MNRTGIESLMMSNGGLVPSSVAAGKILSRMGGMSRFGAPGAIAAGAYGLYELGQATNNFDPEELGKVAASVQKSLEEVTSEAIDVARQIGAPVQDFVNKVVQGYQNESGRTMSDQDMSGRKTIEIDVDRLRNQLNESGKKITREEVEMLNSQPNPFDKMFPGQSLISDEAQHTMPDGTMMPGIDHAAYEANRNMMASGGEMQKYKIEEGDTLTALARKYNVTIEELLRLNPEIKDRDLIYTNRMMTVPGQISTDVGPNPEVEKGIASAFVGPMQEETDEQPTLKEIYNSAKGFMSGLLPDYEGPETSSEGVSLDEMFNIDSNQIVDNIIDNVPVVDPTDISNSIDILGGKMPNDMGENNIGQINQAIANVPSNIENVLQDSFVKLNEFDQYIKGGDFGYDSSKLLNDFKNSAQEIASGVSTDISKSWYTLTNDFVEELNNFAQNNNLTLTDVVKKLDIDWLYQATGVKNLNKPGMANGGEIDMALEDVSRGTMDMQTQPTQEEVSMVQQIMESVMQMVAQGASEEDIAMALQQMGLDQEDIAMVMQVVAQQMQAQPAQEDAIGAELSQMM